MGLRVTSFRACKLLVQTNQRRTAKTLGKTAQLVVREVKALSSCRHRGSVWEPFIPMPYRESFCEENCGPWKLPAIQVSPMWPERSREQTVAGTDS